MPADGLIWWSTPDLSAGLHVRDATVVECWPPEAAHWTLGRDARDLWRRGGADGAELLWVPAGQVHTERLHLGSVYGRRAVAAWKYEAEHVSGNTFLHVGWHPDGRWWADPAWHRDGGHMFTGLDAEAAARARAAELLAEVQRLPGEWVATVAERDPAVLWEVRAVDVPPRPRSASLDVDLR